MSKPVFTQSQVVHQLTTSWGDGVADQRVWYTPTVTYSIGLGAANFPPAGGETAGFTPMTAAETSSAAYAFGLWQDLIPINLARTGSASADISLNFSSTANDGSSPLGKSSYTHPNLNTLSGQPDQILGEQIWIGTGFGADFDPKTDKVVTPTSDAYYYLGGYLILNFMHEIGHALGLSHPDTYDVSGGQPLSFAHNATFSGDFRQYSIMSYFGDYKAGVGWTSADDFHSKVGTDFYPQTPMRDDVLAIQSLYGANFNTRSGDTRYGFHADPSVKSGVYDFTYNKAPLLTIWDGGGSDTLDLSGSGAAQTIDLRPGAYSSVLGFVKNVAIAYNCIIENAVAGSGRNTIIGNDAANVLTAGAGVDRLEGGAGNDTFRLTAAQLTKSDTVLGGAGFDQLAMTTAGAVAAGGVSGVETYALASGAVNTLSLVNANFTGVAGALIRVFGGASGNAIDASALTGSNRVALVGGAGKDSFKFSAASLLAADAVTGGGGVDALVMTTAGTVRAGGVSGIETYTLASSGANALTLVNANVAGAAGASVTVYGGAAGNTVYAAGLTGASRVVMVGGAGKDSFTGGAGSDIFKFSAANLAATDTVRGGLGVDYLTLTTAGTVRAGLVNGVETYVLANGGRNSLTLANANFAGGVAGASITVYGGNAGNTVYAAGLTGASRVVAVGGAGADNFTGGAGNDVFRFSAASLAATDTVRGGLGSDQLALTTAGTVRAGLVNGVEAYYLANGGANSLSLAGANFAGVTGALITVNGGNLANAINAAGLSAANRVVLVGGAGNDIFKFSAAGLTSSDAVKGQGGTDQLALTTAGTVRAGGVAGVETYVLANGGKNSLTLTNANFAGGVTGATITIYGGNAGNTVYAAGLTGASRVVMVGGAGADNFTGGAGSDTFKFTAAALSASDAAAGGGGTDQLALTTAGLVRAGGVKGVEVYRLANGGANSLTLTSANFAGVSGALITVIGGSGANTLSAAGVAAADRAALRGGAGADTLIAGRNALLTGNGGQDRFELTTPGSAAVTIADFNHGVDRIGLSKAGFGLGAAPVAATLFKASATGAFTTAAQRFAYNTASGALRYDADGSGHASALTIASLTHAPTLAAGDLFLIA